MPITLKNPTEIEILRRSGKAASRILQDLGEAVQPGISTRDLDDICRNCIQNLGVMSSFLGYQPPHHPPYPATICASINAEIVHGIPDKTRILKTGDIVGLDTAVAVDGYHGDNAFTFPVGAISPEAQRLINVTREALYLAIQVAKPGNRLGDISHAVQHHAESHGHCIIRPLCGHAIGRQLWEEPQVPNYGTPGRGVRLRPGMVLAIEPMISIGTEDAEYLDDGWTTVTADRSLCAHFEHTVAILSDGPEILTHNPALWGG